jgi:fatty acid desaturase
MTRHDFYCRQIMGSVNFPCGNDFIDTMHGYLNYQIEHHLWPDMTMLQYRKAQPAVKSLAVKYGVSYVQESALLRTLKTVRIMAGVSSQKRLPNTLGIGRVPQ